MLAICVEEIQQLIKSPLGPVQLPTPLYDPVIEALAEHAYRPKSIPELLAHPKLKALQEPEIGEALIVLTGVGAVSPTQQRGKRIEPAQESFAEIPQMSALFVESVWPLPQGQGLGDFLLAERWPPTSRLPLP